MTEGLEPKACGRCLRLECAANLRACLFCDRPEMWHTVSEAARMGRTHGAREGRFHCRGTGSMSALAEIEEAAIEAMLRQEIELRDTRIEQLEKLNATLAKRIDELEAKQ